MAEEKNKETTGDEEVVTAGEDAQKPEEPKEEAGIEEKPEEKPKINLTYAVLLLHSAGKEISEESIKKIVEATGEKVDESQVKALVSSLEGIDIDEAIKQAAVPAGPTEKKEEKKEEKTEEKEEERAEQAAEGLSSLFG